MALDFSIHNRDRKRVLVLLFEKGMFSSDVISVIRLIQASDSRFPRAGAGMIFDVEFQKEILGVNVLEIDLTQFAYQSE